MCSVSAVDVPASSAVCPFFPAGESPSASLPFRHLSDDLPAVAAHATVSRSRHTGRGGQAVEGNPEKLKLGDRSS